MFSKHPLDSDASLLNWQGLTSYIFSSFPKLPLSCLTCQDRAQKSGHGHRDESVQGKLGHKAVLDHLLCSNKRCLCFCSEESLALPVISLKGRMFVV